LKQKGILILAVIFITASLLPPASGSGKKMFVEIQGAVMLPSDGDFKEIYGSTVIYPRGKAGYKFGDHFYAFFGCGVFTVNGETPILREESQSKQRICQIACGYEGNISDQLQFRLEAGGANFNYKEEAFGETVEGSKIGIYLGGSLVYNLSDTFFATFNLGYMGASDEVEGMDINLGGIHTGIGFGFRL